MRITALVLGIVGSIIGVYSGIAAFVAVGGDPAYSSRLWAGWIALILAVIAGLAALLISARPVIASTVMLAGGIVGFVCINLFYINTFYFLAIPFWIVGAVLGFIGARSRAAA